MQDIDYRSYIYDIVHIPDACTYFQNKNKYLSLLTVKNNKFATTYIIKFGCKYATFATFTGKYPHSISETQQYIKFCTHPYHFEWRNMF